MVNEVLDHELKSGVHALSIVVSGSFRYFHMHIIYQFDIIFRQKLQHNGKQVQKKLIKVQRAEEALGNKAKMFLLIIFV